MTSQWMFQMPRRTLQVPSNNNACTRLTGVVSRRLQTLADPVTLTAADDRSNDVANAQIAAESVVRGGNATNNAACRGTARRSHG